MNINKRILTVAVASALGLVGGNVWAAINMDANSVTPTYYASELDLENNALNVATPAVSDPTTTLGFGVSGGNADLYARFDLTNAQFVDTLDPADFTCAPATSSVSTGGSAGQSFVVYNLSTTVGVALPQETPLTLLISGMVDGSGATLKLLNENGATIRYRLYSTPADAVAANGGELKDTGEVDLVAFKSGLTSAISPLSARTASVETTFFQFVAADASPSTNLNRTQLGTIRHQVTAGVYDVSTGAPALTLANLFGATTKYTLEGDFSTATGVFLTAGADCSAVATYTGAINAAKDSATFTIGTNELATEKLCFTTNGTTSMNASDYEWTLNPVAAGATYDVSGISISGEKGGEIDRDGVTLRSGFVSKANAFISRFIFANTGSSDASITDIALFDGSGSATPTTTIKMATPIILPFGQRTSIDMADLINLDTMPKQNLMVEFSIGTTNDKIFGTYQLLLNDSTVQTVVPMERLTSAFK